MRYRELKTNHALTNPLLSLHPSNFLMISGVICLRTTFAAFTNADRTETFNQSKRQEDHRQGRNEIENEMK